MKPEVSIIIPTYNRLEFVRDSVLSAIHQTDSCEVIVVEDGSDESVFIEIATMLQQVEFNNRVRLIQQKHLGVCTARNRGVQEANGELIQFLDSDDLLHPRKIEVQKAILNSDPSLDMCYCLDEYFLKAPGDLATLWNVPSAENHLDRFLWGDPVWCTGSPLWRRSAIEKIGGWPDDLKIGFYDDWVFHIRAILNKINYVYVPLVLHYVRDHPLQRLSLTGRLTDLEKSKSDAVKLISSELKNRELTTSRKDALSATLLFSADTLLTNRFKREGQQAIQLASKYEGSAEMKFLIFMFKLVSRLPVYKLFCKPFRRLLRRRLFQKRGFWKLQKAAKNNLPNEANIKAVLSDLTQRSDLEKISVIICTHNGAAKLKKTLTSRLNQTLIRDLYEIIIVDNGSTDDTRDYIDSLSKERVHPIKYIFEGELGLHFARHAGARAAEGEWLLFTDDDASADAEWLSNYWNAIQKHPAMKAAGGPARPRWDLTPDEWLKRVVGDSSFFPALALMELFSDFRLTPDGLFFGVNLAIKKDVLFSLGGFNPDAFGAVWLGDGESGLLRKLLEKGMHVGYVSDAIVYHHIPPERLTVKYLKQWSRNWGATEAYSKYSQQMPSTLRLMIDLFASMILRTPKIMYIVLRHGGKRDWLSIHRIMWVQYALEQMRYTYRLITSRRFREFVARKDWLNSPVIESVPQMKVTVTPQRSK
ncbi:MAG TPA: glycosyltransferase [Acidobacteriota bacterium]|nr:glycosyltransferase [Acidobacteriota bacterium]